MFVCSRTSPPVPPPASPLLFPSGSCLPAGPHAPHSRSQVAVAKCTCPSSIFTSHVLVVSTNAQQVYRAFASTLQSIFANWSLLAVFYFTYSLQQQSRTRLLLRQYSICTLCEQRALNPTHPPHTHTRTHTRTHTHTPQFSFLSSHSTPTATGKSYYTCELCAATIELVASRVQSLAFRGYTHATYKPHRHLTTAMRFS